MGGMLAAHMSGSVGRRHAPKELQRGVAARWHVGRVSGGRRPRGHGEGDGGCGFRGGGARERRKFGREWNVRGAGPQRGRTRLRSRSSRWSDRGGRSRSDNRWAMGSEGDLHSCRFTMSNLRGLMGRGETVNYPEDSPEDTRRIDVWSRLRRGAGVGTSLSAGGSQKGGGGGGSWSKEGPRRRGNGTTNLQQRSQGRHSTVMDGIPTPAMRRSPLFQYNTGRMGRKQAGCEIKVFSVGGGDG